MIGVNHRNLSTLILDHDRALNLRSSIPDDRLAVAESGIGSAERLKVLWDGGYSAFLIGGHIASAPDPESELRSLMAGTYG